MEIYVKMKTSSIGASETEIVPFTIIGNVPTEEELLHIEEMSKTWAIDTLSFEWCFDIIEDGCLVDSTHEV